MLDLGPACSETMRVIAAVTDDQRRRPTPCGDYVVQDVIDHLAEVSGGSVGVADRDTAGLERLAEAWSDPSAWTGVTNAGGVSLSNEVWGRITLTEVVVHGWDLARAIGDRYELPEETLRATLDHVIDFIPVAPLPELWGPPVSISPTAPLIDQIVARTGRDPAAFR